MNLLRLDASIFPDNSASAEMADIVEGKWLEAHPTGTIVRRHLGLDPLPQNAWADATVAQFASEGDRTPVQREALALANVVAAELKDADAVLLAIPLYNFGVSQHVKAWIDLVITATGPSVPVLEGTPTVLVTVRGGGYGAGSPREGWDHSTPYLRRVFSDVWGADLTVVEREFTLAKTTPAMEALRPLAAQAHVQALEEALQAGELLQAKTLAVQ